MRGGVQLAPDQGNSWYLWRLSNPTFWTQATAWDGYVLHQLFMWGTVLYAKRNVTGYTSGLHPINVIALVGNAAFVLLQLAQTQLFYDRLAQNVPLESSETSVVLLLVLVLLLETRRQGLFFGKKPPFLTSAAEFVRRNHGYVFAWAAIYTFWFHPIVTTPQHLVGFLCMVFLLTQASLFFTRMHLNRYWTVFLELLFLAHGVLVISMLGRSSSIRAFVLSVFDIFLLTQMHELKLKRWLEWSLVGLCLLTTAVVFTQRGERGTLTNVLMLPVLEYGLLLLFILAGLIAAAVRQPRRYSEPIAWFRRTKIISAQTVS